jgi:integrase
MIADFMIRDRGANGRRHDPSRTAARSNETSPGGSLRVKVYAGFEPLSGKRHCLDEVVSAGSRAAAEAEKVRTAFLHEVDERRNPKTRAKVNQLLDRYLESLDVEPTTRTRYEGIIRIHLRPALGSLPLSKLDSDILDRFFGQRRRCRERCKGRARHVKHGTQREHECDEQCVVVPCRPLSVSSVRQTHWVLNAAFQGAVRWRWIGRNPLDETQPPPPPSSNPSPPSPAEAARLLEEAWKDPEWGAFVWTAMTTGTRRGELCALRRSDVDLGAKLIHVRTGLKLADRKLVRRDTKTHQQRRDAPYPAPSVENV